MNRKNCFIRNKSRKKVTDLEEWMAEVSLLLRAQKRPEP